MDLIQAVANVSPDVPEGLAQTSTVGFGVADADQAGIGEQFLRASIEQGMFELSLPSPSMRQRAGSPRLRSFGKRRQRSKRA